MSNSQPAIRVERLSKRYGSGRVSAISRCATACRRSRGPWHAGALAGVRVWALRVSFDVAQGSVVGVIGVNGAGSTLLKIRPTRRHVGPDPSCADGSAAAEVGTGFHPELTGRENVHLSGAMLGMRRAEIARKFDEIVDFAGVERFIDTPLKQYSSGMAVRLGFAVAAHLETDILIVDEALAVGDVAFQQKCLGRMAGVAKDGRTVLFVSHDLAAIRSLTETSICLEKPMVATVPRASWRLARYSTTSTTDGRGSTPAPARDGR